MGKFPVQDIFIYMGKVSSPWKKDVMKDIGATDLWIHVYLQTKYRSDTRHTSDINDAKYIFIQTGNGIITSPVSWTSMNEELI